MNTKSHFEKNTFNLRVRSSIENWVKRKRLENLITDPKPIRFTLGLDSFKFTEILLRMILSIGKVFSSNVDSQVGFSKVYSLKIKTGPNLLV